MPLSLIVVYGLTPTALQASIRALVMLLCPHPLQSVDGEPWYARVGSEKLWPLDWTSTIASLLGMSGHLARRGWVERGDGRCWMPDGQNPRSGIRHLPFGMGVSLSRDRMPGRVGLRRGEVAEAVAVGEAAALGE